MILLTFRYTLKTEHVNKILPLFLLFLSLFVLSIPSLKAQTLIPNGDFEAWEGVGTNSEEPTHWSSNKTGGGIANIGPQTCSRESANVFAGTYCVKIETKSYFTVEVNGSVTTGQVVAPNTNPANGYVHTVRADANFNSPFSGRPDSLVGYYKYVSENNDQGKIEVYLHGDYDVENPDQGGSAPFIIATATYLTPTADVNSWTRFSVPFVYTSTDTPQYILAVMASSAVAGAGEAGSTLWVDELEAIYPAGCEATANTIIESACDAYFSPSGLYTWTETGSYTDTLLNAGGCDSILSIDLTIETVEIGLTQTGNTLTATAADAGFQWISCSNGHAIIPGATNQSFTPAANGDYAVIVSQGNCTDTSACLTVSTVSIERNAFAREIRLFPNPATEYLAVDLGDRYQEIELRVYDLNGRLVARQSLRGRQAQSQLSLNVQALSSGIYFLQIRADGREARIKWMR